MGYNWAVRKVAIAMGMTLVIKGNGSVLKNPEISGAIFILNLSILILNSQCVEGARDFRVL